MVLALGDWLLGGRALSFFVGKPIVMLQGVFCAMLLAGAIAAISVGDIPFLAAGAWSWGLFVACIMSMWIVSRQEREGAPAWEASDMPDLDRDEIPQDADTLREALLWMGLLAAVILGAGTVVSQAAEAAAEQTGLGQSFIGATLLGIVTSLPEISTLTAAIRLKRYAMAFGDIFGTNIFDIALIFVVDIVFDGDPVLGKVGDFSQVAAAIGIVVTLLYVAGLLRRREKPLGRMGLDSWAVVAAYVGGVAILYTLR